jgi:hypothetical protein
VDKNDGIEGVEGDGTGGEKRNDLDKQGWYGSGLEYVREERSKLEGYAERLRHALGEDDGVMGEEIGEVSGDQAEVGISGDKDQLGEKLGKVEKRMEELGDLEKDMVKWMEDFALDNCRVKSEAGEVAGRGGDGEGAA